MFRFVFVRFAATAVNARGEPFSFEPRKWRDAIHQADGRYFSNELDRITSGQKSLRQRIQYCWLSEYETSLNLIIELQATTPEAQVHELDLLKKVFNGALEIAEPQNTAVPQAPETARVLPFRVKAA